MKPFLIISDHDFLRVLIQMISTFELTMIKSPEVRVMTKFNLMSLNMRLQRMIFLGSFKNKKITIKVQELAALRILAIGSGMAQRAVEEPFLWIIYNQLMDSSSDHHIRSC